MKLVEKETGRQIHKGEVVISFRGEPYVLDGFDRDPNKPWSTGRVHVKDDHNSTETVSFYPGVFNAEITFDD